MGMLIQGVWSEQANQSMKDGRYKRQKTALPQLLKLCTITATNITSDNLVLVASHSCPWSHATIIAHALSNQTSIIPIQLAIGPRTEGYQLAPNSAISAEGKYIHQLYSKTNPTYTGRATVPLLWDKEARRIISNDSTAILRFFDNHGSTTDLRPEEYVTKIDKLLTQIYDGLANAVYRAGRAQRQDEYEQAVAIVYATLDSLEIHLNNQKYLITTYVTEPDIRLFTTLVRFDSVYATHFRCTRYRLTDFPNLWRFTRDLYHMPEIRNTVDFEEIRKGYYLNDGDHNPHKIIAEQPILNWRLTY